MTQSLLKVLPPPALLKDQAFSMVMNINTGKVHGLF